MIKAKRYLKKKLYYIILLLFFILLLFNVFFSVFAVSGYSMYPTIFDKDIAICLRYSIYPFGIRHNDIIIFEKDDKRYIKRVVAIEDDIVEYKDSNILVNGVIVKSQATSENKTFVVPHNYYFVLGDFSFSNDSRQMGMIKNEEIKSIYIFKLHLPSNSSFKY